MHTQHPVHVAHLIWHFGTGGLENGVVNLINTLPKEQFVHSIITLTGHQEEFARRLTNPNVQFYCLQKKEGHDWAILFRLNVLLKQLKPDVLHSRNLTTLELQLVGWWRRVPLRLHGEHGWDSYDIGGSNKKYRLLRWILKGFVHRFICLSAESEHYLRYRVGVAQTKLERICNGVDTEKFDHAVAADLVSLGLESQTNQLVIGTVGRLAKIKNQALLINAFALLLQQEPHFKMQCKLLLIGDGACREELEQLATQHQLTDSIIFAGNRNDIAAVMCRLDIFVLPSLAEGISNTILEAMASGVPVIATNVGGNPELLPEQLHQSNLINSGDVAALASAMSRYLQSPQQRSEHGMLVKKHCQQHFSIARMVERYRALYVMTRKQT